MKKKILITILMLTFSLCTMFGLSACSSCSPDKHEHSYTISVTDPTCTEKGYTTYTCTCGDSYVDNYVNELGHNFTYSVTDPTCTEKGYTTYTCTCGDSYVDNYVNELGHNFTYSVTDPTCTEKGYTTYTCTCGDSYVDNYVNELGHNFTYWRYIQACGDENLYAIRICKQCGKIETQGKNVIHPHEFERMPTSEPSCTQDGVSVWFECKNCGFDIKGTIPALGHDYSWTYIKQATCTEKGLRHGICNRCEYEIDDEYFKEHDWDNGEVLKIATCTEDGETLYTCLRCFKEEIRIETALGHDWDEGVIEKEPTCTEKGVKKYTCLRCGGTKGEEIGPNGHTLTIIVTFKGNCYEKSKYYYKCTVCDYESDEIEGGYYHADVSENIINEPFCLIKGLKQITCNLCGAEWQEDIPALVHNYEKFIEKEATCIEKGAERYTCSRCDDTYYKEIKALGHDWEITYYKMFTCFSNGFINHKCNMCEAVWGIKLLAPNQHNMSDEMGYSETHHYDYCKGQSFIHTYGKNKILDLKYDCGHTTNFELHDLQYDVKIKTRETNGEKIYLVDVVRLCSICNYNELIHSEKEIVHVHNLFEPFGSKEPTCLEAGLLPGLRCSTCKEVFIEPEHVDALGHNFEHGSCTRCGAEYYTGGLEYVIFQNQVYITNYVGSDTEIIIPSKIERLPVVGITATFAEKNITSITLPYTLKYVNVDTFKNCNKLTKVNYTGTMDEWVSIDFKNEYANPLRYAKNLYINEEIVSELYITTATYICNYAFYSYDSLTSVVIGNSVTSIGEDAFYNCTSLTSIEIPDSVTSIGEDAFYNCDSLTSVEIPDSVTSIGSGAFEYCDSLTSVVIGNSVTSIGSSAFEDCYSLTSVTIGNGVTSIGSYAFEYCSSLTSIEIPNSVTSIGYGAFYNCDSLTSVEIPDSVTSIGDRAFGNCDSLTSVEIPDSVTSIGDRAFGNCTSLKSINVAEENNYYKDIDGSLYSKDGTTLIQYAAGKTDKSFVIPSSVTSIGEDAFYSCTSLTSIEIPNRVTSIGSYAFYDCNKLTSITIPDSVTSIGLSAFSGCHSLTSITIPDSVTSIGSSAFSGCHSLTSITIPDSVISIGSSAFYDCDSLTINVAFSSKPSGWHSSWNGNCPVVWGDVAVLSTVTIDGIKYTYVGNGWEVADYVGSENSVIIPSLVQGKPVIGIGEDAFYNCKSLTSIEIPDSVTSIGGSAFRGCSSLTSITIGNGATSIGEYAFYNCDSLTSVTIGNGVTSIGSYAFYNCDSLTSVTIGNGVTSIGSSAFEDCYSLTSVTIGNGVTSIGSYAFDQCTSLTSVEIPNGVTSIGSGAFSYCYSLTSVTIGNGVTSIGSGAFSYCYSLTSINVAEGNNYYKDINDNLYSKDGTTLIQYAVGKTDTSFVIPSSVTSIGYGAFEYCDSLTSVTIGDSVTSIGFEAFYSCTSLTSIEIPNSVTSIGSDAFENCKSLTSIEIPDSVTSIGGSAFRGCSSLTSIEIPNSVTSIGYHAFENCTALRSITLPVLFNGDANLDILVGCNNLERIYVADGNNLYLSINNALYSVSGKTLIKVVAKNSYNSFVIPNGVETISARAFEDCDSLTSIEIPNSVTSIGSYAFYSCTSLTSIEIPNSVTSIGSYAFEDCYSLTSVTIGNGVTSIGSYAFYDRSSLTSVTIGNGVTSIGSYAFYGCSSLTSIIVDENNEYYKSIDGNLYSKDGKTLIQYAAGKTDKSYVIPSSVTSIGEDAFYGCDSLTSIEIPDSVTSIGSSAFSGCSSLTSVTIGNGVTSIGSSAFSGCSSLTSVTIGNGVTSIGAWAFTGCDSLTSITIGSGVTSIGYEAFYGCSSLTSIEIPDSVTSIGSRAFDYCRSLTSIEIPNSVTSIGSGAFEDCDSLTSIEIPNSVTSIGEFAFRACDNLTINVAFSSKPSGWHSSWNGNCPVVWGDVAVLSTVTIDGIKYTYVGNGWEVADYVGSENSVIIPSLVQGKPVIGIGEDAFEDCDSLTSVTIGDSVTSIGSSAFYNCDSLTSVTIGNGVTSIGEFAFANCSSLTSVNYLGTIDQWVQIEFARYSNALSYSANLYINDVLVTEVNLTTATKINDYAFYGYDSLTSIEIPNSVTSIGYGAFYNCDSLTSVTIGNGVTSIGSYAFDQCTSLTSVEIPNGVTSIGSSAFEDCYSLTSVTIGNGVTSIGSGAFSYCYSLTSINVAEGNNYYKDINDNLYSKDGTTLIQYAVGKTDTSFVIPSSVTSIGNYAFYGCSSLTSVTIGNGVTSIGFEAFYSCTSLTSIEIPNSVTSIGSDAFENCKSLTSIEIPNSVTSIGSGAFEDCDSLTSIEIPNSVTSIGNYAFYDCSKLTSVEIGDSVTHIGSSAFRDCTSLTSVIIGSGIKEIGSSAFERGVIFIFSYQTDIVLDDGWSGDAQVIWAETWVKYTEDFYFSIIGNELTLTKYVGTSEDVIIPDEFVLDGIKYSVTQISDNIFDKPQVIKSISIGKNIKSIDNSIFSSCDNLQTFTLSSENKYYSYENGTLYNKDKSAIIAVMPFAEGNYTVNDSVTAIYSHAFVPANLITSVYIGENVNFIGTLAFMGMKANAEFIVEDENLFYSDVDGVLFNKDKTMLISYPAMLNNTNFVVPDSVKSIDIATFMNVKHLESLTLDFRVIDYHEIGYLFAFDNYEDNILPENLKQIIVKGAQVSNNAFNDCNTLETIVLSKSITEIGYYAFDNCEVLTAIYYEGSKEDWENISIDARNNDIANLTIYYYTEDIEHVDGDNYWKYDNNGEIVIWEFSEELK